MYFVKKKKRNNGQLGEVQDISARAWHDTHNNSAHEQAWRMHCAIGAPTGACDYQSRSWIFLFLIIITIIIIILVIFAIINIIIIIAPKVFFYNDRLLLR